jgi:hypothetical protein
VEVRLPPCNSTTSSKRRTWEVIVEAQPALRANVEAKLREAGLALDKPLHEE